MMSNRQLAKAIVGFLPFWELPYTTEKENIKSYMENFEDITTIKETIEYLEEYNNSKELREIKEELKKRIKEV